MQNKKLKTNLDSIIIGFAIFAMFFGAGNLIFPPYLGLRTGSNWLIAFIGFVIGDIFLVSLGVMSGYSFTGDDPLPILQSVGKLPSMIMGSLICLAVGPFLAIPRTGAVSYEISIQPIFPSINRVVFSIIFFSIALLLAITESKIIDIIGKYLTPILLIGLVTLILIGIFKPIGISSSNAIVRQNLFSEGLTQGYQTLDSINASAIGVMVITSIKARGHKESDVIFKVMAKSTFIMAMLLILVYGGLCYIGSTAIMKYDGNTIQQTELLICIVKDLMGKKGEWLLGVIVLFACMTTTVGLSGMIANYFAIISRGKISYKLALSLIIIVSAFLSILGTSTIIQYAVPILSIMYPLTITMTVLTIFNRKINNNIVYKIGAVVALIMGILEAVKVPFLSVLPFQNLDLGWICPVTICCLASFIFSKNKYTKEENVLPREKVSQDK